MGMFKVIKGQVGAWAEGAVIEITKEHEKLGVDIQRLKDLGVIEPHTPEKGEKPGNVEEASSVKEMPQTEERPEPVVSDNRPAPGQVGGA